MPWEKFIIDDTGTPVSRYTYEPFGRIVEDSSDWPQATSNDFMFTGQWAQ